MRIALTCNIRPAGYSEKYIEWDDPSTVETIIQGLKTLGHEAEVVDCMQRDAIEEKLTSIKPDFVFNIAEGLTGENRESVVPQLLEKLNIPYTGSGPETLMNCLNKSRTKTKLQKHGIPTATWCEIDKPLAKLPEKMAFPVIVKPLYEGSSKGIHNDNLVDNNENLLKKTGELLEKFQQPMIVETFLNGREFTVAMLGNGDSLKVLPIVELNFDSLPAEANRLYSFEAKWIWDRTEKPLEIFTCPAKLSEELKDEIEATARNAFRILNCRDWCRIDLRQDASGKVNVIEINPLPGIIPDPHANSCFPKAARAKGLNYIDIINCVLTSAIERSQ
ncbi:MAG: ATP-grasp domain-containing protein [Candidatus Aureabacteria bacterium]|nr:ATP-grasp domain-containing protein [Candidatus Auribacterota bacterium]